MHHAINTRFPRAIAILGIAVLLGTAFPARSRAQDEPVGVDGGQPSETGASDADPSETDPGETDPGETDLGETDPGETELGESDPGETEAETFPPAGLLADPSESADETEPRESTEEPAAPAQSNAMRFASSVFSWSNAVTFNSFAPGAQLSYDPMWVMSFGFNPRFYLTDTTFLWLNQGLSVELTDTNDNTYNREPQLDDTLLDLRQNIRWEGFVLQAQARLGFPLSKASQAAGRVLQTGLGLTITRPFPELASFTVTVSGGYRRWWATRNYVGTTAPVYSMCEQIEGTMPSFCTQGGARTPARDIVVTSLALSVMPASGLTVSFTGFYLGMYGSEIAPTEVTINGGTVSLGDDSPTHWRHYTLFALEVGYDVVPWLNLSLGVQSAGVAAPLYNPDGSVRSPFNPDTQVYLTTTIALDSLYDVVAGTEDEELTPEERQRRRQGVAESGSPASF